MRLLTFSFLRNCRFKRIYTNFAKLHFDTALPRTIPDNIQGDPSLIEVSESWPKEEQAELREAALRDMQVWPEFISEDEESALMAELEPVLQRMRYEYDHWDDAIHGYRETERVSWQEPAAGVVSRVRRAAFASAAAGSPLPHAHVLDLAPNGHIKPHVDAVRFCGAVIAGLSLCSSAVMRLVHEQHKHLQFDAMLPRRSLYIMRGVSRYQFSHAVLGGAHSEWRGQRVPRARRVAVICRSRPEHQ